MIIPRISINFLNDRPKPSPWKRLKSWLFEEIDSTPLTIVRMLAVRVGISTFVGPIGLSASVLIATFLFVCGWILHPYSPEAFQHSIYLALGVMGGWSL